MRREHDFRGGVRGKYAGRYHEEKPAALIIRFTRISPTHHCFQYVREDGTGESAEFETRSVLFHDLLHFAVETEARLAESFYGQLLKGRTLAQLGGKDPMSAPMPVTGEIIMTERIVGALTNVVKRDVDSAAFFAAVKNMLDACGEPMPPYLTDAFVARVKERMRGFVGAWNATPFGKTMELHLAPNAKSVAV